MKTLLTLGLLLSTLVIGILYPQLANNYPKLKALGLKVKSLVPPFSAKKPTSPIVVVSTTPRPQLNAGQVKFLEAHQRRHELLRKALQMNRGDN